MACCSCYNSFLGQWTAAGGFLFIFWSSVTSHNLFLGNALLQVGSFCFLISMATGLCHVMSFSGWPLFAKNNKNYVLWCIVHLWHGCCSCCNLFPVVHGGQFLFLAWCSCHYFIDFHWVAVFCWLSLGDHYFKYIYIYIICAWHGAFVTLCLMCGHHILTVVKMR